MELRETSGGVEPVEEEWVELPILPVDFTLSSTGVVSSSLSVWRWRLPVVATPAFSWMVPAVLVLTVVAYEVVTEESVSSWRLVWRWRPPSVATPAYYCVVLGVTFPGALRGGVSLSGEVGDTH